MMTNLKEALVCALVGFLLGGAISWYIHGKFDQAAISKEQKAQIDLANKRADERVADERKAKQDAEADLAGEQAQTLKLNQWLNEARATNVELQGKIGNATFTAPPRALPLQPDGQPAARCPGAAIGSPEFVQLYHAAAYGAATGGAGGATDAGGVHQASVR
jgi:hypothetical protein